MRYLKNNFRLLSLLPLALLLAACSHDVNYEPPAGNSETAITHYSFGQMVVDGTGRPTPET